MESVSKKNNFIYLVVSLVALLLVGALVSQFPSALGQHIFQAVSVVTLAMSTFGFRYARLRLQTSIVFTLSVLIIVLLGVFLNANGMSSLHLFVLIIFYLWMTWLAAKQILFSGHVDGNKVVGAISIYLLIGLIWALLYLFIAQTIPGAFNGLEQRLWYDNFADGAYFSFVTLTTLGYGDISPVVPIARFLVYMEAIVGVFYLTILVASLIGIRISTLLTDHE